VTDTDVVTVAPSIKTKSPEPRRQAATMWLSPGGKPTGSAEEWPFDLRVREFPTVLRAE
jgi:hypothetical protein